MEIICVTCGNLTTKYKCPKCFARYCSVDCFKQHTNAQCKAEKVAIPSGKLEQEKEATLFGPFVTEDTVPHEKLSQLKNSEGVRNLLYNPHLRNLLKEIDTAPNVSKAIEAAMHEPLFIEIADEFLKIVEPESFDLSHHGN